MAHSEASVVDSFTRQDQAHVGKTLESVRRRIDAAARRRGRQGSHVRLVAITKNVGAELLVQAIEAGIEDIGENRIQEALAKQTQVAALLDPGRDADIRWHLVGHLQSNKAKRAASALDVVHSLDRERIAQVLNDHRRADVSPLRVLIEVELTGIAERAGVKPEGLVGLAERVAQLPRLSLEGLMAMAPQVPDPGETRPYFTRLRELRDDLEGRLGRRLPELSMGMSDDFEVAVEEGATMVRVGRAIFSPS